MRIISQNVVNYGIDMPEGTMFRVNLACRLLQFK